MENLEAAEWLITEGELEWDLNGNLCHNFLELMDDGPQFEHQALGANNGGPGWQELFE